MNGWLLSRSRGTLFAQVFALVLLVVVGAEAINLYIVFNLPPPAPNFYTEGDVMRVLRGQPPSSRLEKNGAPPLLYRRSAQPPAFEPEARFGFVNFRKLVAEDLGITPSDIVITTAGGPPDFRGYSIVASSAPASAARATRARKTS
jgi:hypothetical protein